MVRVPSRVYNCIPGLLTYMIVFGNLIKIPNIRVAGVVITAFRFTILIFFLLFLLILIRNTPFSVIPEQVSLLLMLGIWIAVGTASLFISPYSDRYLGMKDILSLTFGLMILLCFFQFSDERSFDDIAKAIRISIIILCCIATIEITTGIHLNVSRLSGLEDTDGLFFVKTDSHLASAIFYNENDLCSFLAIFSPVLFYRAGEKGALRRPLAWCFTAAVFGVFLVDDASIAAFSAAIAVIFYLIRNRKNKKTRSRYHSLLFLLIPIGLAGLAFVTRRVFTILKTQISNSTLGYGSLRMRLDIYADCIKAAIKTYGLGVGAGGFPNYILAFHPESRLVNPHNWWLEILAGYGVAVFALYVFSYLQIGVHLKKNDRREHSDANKVTLACLLSLAFACLGPSQFLGYYYPWMLFAWCVLALKRKNPTTPC